MSFSVMSAGNCGPFSRDTIVISKGTDDLYVCCRGLGTKRSGQERDRVGGEVKVKVERGYGNGGMGCACNVH